MVERPGKYLDRWFWDARLMIWRVDPRVFLAETPEGMGCEGWYEYEEPDR
jgi:hypothetical protein